ncbi:MAG: MMPL family transporter [Clostridiales bacterium]|jgi:predicted RND superfamily exporter protein|nr:MMPL family transporter [Clostridiales bacterium]
MKRLTDFIVDKRIWFAAAFIALAVAGAVCIPFVKINYDATKYLPKDSETAKGVEVLTGEFGDKSSLQIMIKDVTPQEAIGLKNRIAEIDGIENAVFLDDVILQMKPMLQAMLPPGLLPADMPDGQLVDYALTLIYADPANLPPELAPFAPQLAAFAPQLQQLKTQLDGFYKNGNALITATTRYGSYDERTVEAVNQVAKLDGLYLVGPAVTAHSTITLTVSEVLTAAAILIPLLLVLLFLGTGSFWEPVLFLLVIGVSIMLNLGTNIFFGSISYLTNAIAALLQLALSMDYSIFLLHKFKQEKDSGLAPAAAMKSALKKSLSPVGASSLTTIAGFAALMFMRYTIGLDIGLVLAKGIIFSLLSVFLFMPAATLFTHKLLEKSKHGSLFDLFGAIAKRIKRAKKSPAPAPQKTPTLIKTDKSPWDAFAKFVYKTRFILPVVAIALIIPSYFGQNANTFTYGEFTAAGGENMRLTTDKAAVDGAFGNQNSIVVLVKNDAADKESALLAAFAAKEKVLNAQSPFTVSAPFGGATNTPAEILAQFSGKNYYRVILSVDIPEEGDESFALADDIRKTAKEILGDSEFYVLGSTPATRDIKNVITDDFKLVNLLTMLFIAAILLVTFRTIPIPLVLLCLIQGAVWINMAIPFLFSQPIVFTGYMLLVCIQMGATIDYGILLASNYKDARKTLNKRDAMKKAAVMSSGSVLLSASVLCATGFVLGLASTLPATSLLGMSLGRGALSSMILMTVVLPQILVLLPDFKRKRPLAGVSGGADGTSTVADAPDLPDGAVADVSGDIPVEDISGANAKT